MSTKTRSRNGNGKAFVADAAGLFTREGVETARIRVNAPADKEEKPPEETTPEVPAPRTTLAHNDRLALAVFCYAEPDSVIGQYVLRTVTALARRQTPIHLFTRHEYNAGVGDVFVYPVGECTRENLLDSVQEFARQACNAFLQRFPNGCARLTLMGFEWSSIPALSILRGLKHVNAILSLHSLERQRGDLASELSKGIEEIELNGLREARAILVQDAGTAEIAKFWVPECAGRITTARQPFPVHHFTGPIDAGAIKARYQVGPVDPTVLYLGDLDDRYGPDMVVKSLPAILKNNKQVRLIVVGDGAQYWPLRVYTRYLLLEHAVRLVGSVTGQALEELIQAADVIVVPSREATPWWPILAAWAATKPVVATHVAAPGLVEHGKDSLLFYPTENSCVWGIEHVLFNPELAQVIAAQGHRKLEDRFGWGSVAAQVEELLGLPAQS